MFNQISKLFKSLTVVAFLLLSGCGGGTGTTALGGSMTINPTSVAFTNTTLKTTAPCTTGTRAYSYTRFVITVFNTNKVPVANAPLSVTLDFSNATNGNLMTLYDDPSWGSSSTSAPTNAVGGSYSTSTGSDGTKTLIVGWTAQCAFKGNLSVYSGDLYQQASVAVTAGGG